MPQNPNIVYVFADQWRVQSLGYTGNNDVKTPHIDQLNDHHQRWWHMIGTAQSG